MGLDREGLKLKRRGTRVFMVLKDSNYIIGRNRDEGVKHFYQVTLKGDLEE